MPSPLTCFTCLSSSIRFFREVFYLFDRQPLNVRGLSFLPSSHLHSRRRENRKNKNKKQEVNNQKNNKNRMRGKFTLNTFTPRSRPLLLSLLMNPANERNEACSNITPSCAGTTREFQWRWMRRVGCCVLLLHHQTFFLPLYTQRRAPPPSTK